MNKERNSKMASPKKAVLVLLPLAVILIVLILVAVSSSEKREVVINDFGFAFIDTGRIVGVMRVPGAEADIRDMIEVLSPEDPLEIDDGVPEYRGEKLAAELPVFFDENRYLYIPWEEAVFLDRDLELKKFEGKTFLHDKGFFDEERVLRDSSKNLLLLSCTRNLYVALGEFSIISSGERADIKPKDLVLFDGYNVRKATVSETTAKRESYGIGKDSLVVIGDRSYLMDDFLGVLGLTVERDSVSGGLEKLVIPDEEEKEDSDTGEAAGDSEKDTKSAPKPIEEMMIKIPEETFQYSIGYRYDLPENLEVYSSKGTWYQKRENFTSTLDSAPLFGEETIYLPGDYAIYDFSERRQSYLPAFSRVGRTLSEYGNASLKDSNGENEKKPGRSVIYDGKNYIFTDTVTVSWKNESYTLPPFSYICYDGQEILEFYNPEEDTFKTYILQLDSIKIMFDDGNGVDVAKRYVLFDEQPQILIADNISAFDSLFE